MKTINKKFVNMLICLQPLTGIMTAQYKPQIRGWKGMDNHSNGVGFQIAHR